MTFRVSSSSLPYTVTLWPATPASWIICLAFAMSGAAFGSPYGHGSIFV